MKARKVQAVGTSAVGSSREREAQRELENFLRALSSYPDRFAREPYLSFEQHLCSVAMASQPASAAVARHRN